MSEGQPVLLETVRVSGGKVPLMHLHQDRLDRSRLAHALGRVSLDPPVDRDGAVRCRISPESIRYEWRPGGDDGPVRLATWPRPFLPYPHKSIVRKQFDDGKAWAVEHGADEALFVTGEGWVAESGIWAVLWWDGDTLAGPPLDLGILPSVARARLLEAGVEVREERLQRGETGARLLVVANAVRGVVPVASLDGEPVPGHRLTGEIAALFRP
ncbi:MAG: aminotransferase class IV [Gemmatimonadales bacterium]